MRRSLLASHRRLLTVLALAVASLLPAVSASARPVAGGGAPATTGADPASTAQAASFGVASPIMLGLLLAVLCVGAAAYLAGIARERRTAAHGV